VTRIQRSALVGRPARVMFDLVADVARYPERFPWCTAARVEAVDPETVLASLDVRFAGMTVRFATRNRHVVGESIEMALAEGPFKSLGGRWTFAPLGEDGSRIALDLDFEVAGRYLGGVLAGGFRSLADRMVDDFVRAARALPA
jgi:ribosome-associated toxin RatA of RatAB toxin-antitoxin module